MPFPRGKTRFFVLNNQENKTKNKKQKTKHKNNKKTNKEGFGPSEVALWATSPDP